MKIDNRYLGLFFYVLCVSVGLLVIYFAIKPQEHVTQKTGATRYKLIHTLTPEPTVTKTLFYTETPTLTQTPTKVVWTLTPTPYPSPTGMQCEVEQQWGRGPGHDFEYGCFALSCGFADGTSYGNNLVCLVDKSIGTPWPYEWNFYHPLIGQLKKGD